MNYCLGNPSSSRVLGTRSDAFSDWGRGYERIHAYVWYRYHHLTTFYIMRSNETQNMVEVSVAERFGNLAVRVYALDRAHELLQGALNMMSRNTSISTLQSINDTLREQGIVINGGLLAILARNRRLRRRFLRRFTLRGRCLRAEWSRIANDYREVCELHRLRHLEFSATGVCVGR